MITVGISIPVCHLQFLYTWAYGFSRQITEHLENKWFTSASYEIWLFPHPTAPNVGASSYSQRIGFKCIILCGWKSIFNIKRERCFTETKASKSTLTPYLKSMSSPVTSSSSRQVWWSNFTMLEVNTNNHDQAVISYCAHVITWVWRFSVASCKLQRYFFCS